MRSNAISKLTRISSVVTRFASNFRCSTVHYEPTNVACFTSLALNEADKWYF